LCSLKGFVSKYAIATPQVTLPGISLTSGFDSLLIPNTTATLVGWADSALDTQDDVTINGSTAGGFHESFVRMPLDVGLSGPSNVPSDYIAGQVVDVQGTDVQAVHPGIYTMTTGSLTLEFVLPRVEHTGISGLTVRVPNMLGSSALQGNVNYLEAHLYNWQTGRWDTLQPAGQDSCVTEDGGTYVGPDGSVLLRVAKQGMSLETVVLGKPSLELR
jgi:hypothetical protein